MSTLLAHPETADAIADADAVVALVGGYDGAGNFGDIALLDAARSLIERLGGGVLALPVVSQSQLAAHRGRDERPVLVFGEPADDLIAVTAPAAPSALYIYGGGYLNASFGPLRLAMAEAAERQLAVTVRVASGLQADADWAPAAAELLARCAFVGARDPESASALPGAVLTGDDAIAVLPAPSGAEPEPRVNAHFADHPWTTHDAGATEERWLTAIAAIEGKPVVQPVIAYDDATTSDRPALERFARRCAELGHEIAEPVVLRGGDTLPGAAAVLERASLTLSCSFHVALTTLMLGVPTKLAADTPYYEQKAAGLRADFGLNGHGIARSKLLERAARLRTRRARVEGDLLAALGGGLLTGATARLAERAQDAVALRAQLAQLRLGLQAAQREVTNPLLPADARLAVEEAAARADASRAARASEQARRRAAEVRIGELESAIEGLQEQLDVVYSSRSWKLTRPLRAMRSERPGSTL
ncbi:MAG TPA: polysaccharide pyruvyl transferase family protein [Solirubrobacteraceae bacterium]|nr:polysaccharide pyruvyl transferase family protein [Solirubrobacteraceae bacterium]